MRQRKNIKKNRMKNFSLNKIHIYLSIGLYVASLIFPACYVGESRDAQSSLELLMVGPFGLIVGVFAWYANPLFWFALYKHKDTVSMVAAFFALLLALSFLSYKRVMYIDMDFQKEITSLGWGYFLWLLSISIFLIGQIFVFCGAPKYLVPISTMFPITVIGYFIYIHYYKVEDSQYSVQKERDRIYRLECVSAGTKIYEIVDNVRSVYISGGVSEYERHLNLWKIKSNGFFLNGYVNSGFLLFYEQENFYRKNADEKRNTPFERYSSSYNSYKNGKEYIDEITSDASVIIKNIEYPGIYEMKVGQITIKDRRTDKILAESKYVYDVHGKRLCGETSKGVYSLHDLVKRVMSLKKQFPSIYDN
jgi:hypothetical protein